MRPVSNNGTHPVGKGPREFNPSAIGTVRIGAHRKEITMRIRHLLAALFAALSLSALAAVDANQATQADLESVKGIGPGLSGKILAARQQGPFKDWADLVDRVAGVGPGNAARFSQAGLTVAGSAYASAEGTKPAAEPRRKAARDAGAAADGETSPARPAARKAMGQ